MTPAVEATAHITVQLTPPWRLIADNDSSVLYTGELMYEKMRSNRSSGNALQPCANDGAVELQG